MATLDDLGFSEFFATRLQQVREPQGLVPARVVGAGMDVWELAGCRATLGTITGRLRRALTTTSRPTTGDWVAVVDGSDRAVIHQVLERETCLTRRASGPDDRDQVVAANLTVCFVVTSANRDFNVRRLERYLTAVQDGGSRPVVVINKIDLVDDAASYVDAVRGIGPGVPCVAVSATTRQGMDEVERHLGVGVTVGVVGSSGVGKSTLINALSGGAQATDHVRRDGKGRHTTTRRELVVLPGRGVLIDTPGMREFGVVADQAAVEATFEDIDALATECRFRDCAHGAEPGCGVQAAVEEGRLDPGRLASYEKLTREVASAEVRRDPARRAEQNRQLRSMFRQWRRSAKERDRTRSR